MKIVYQGGEGEIVEKKSRFIATVRPISSEEEAAAFVNEMKKKYWDARHNCFAFTLGEHHETCRCSDDGEPSQTAGRPMLDVLLKEDIHNVAVVVTRYFGGTLLGTGGLVRAYQKATQEGLAASRFRPQAWKEACHWNGLYRNGENPVPACAERTSHFRYGLHRAGRTSGSRSDGRM